MPGGSADRGRANSAIPRSVSRSAVLFGAPQGSPCSAFGLWREAAADDCNNAGLWEPLRFVISTTERGTERLRSGRPFTTLYKMLDRPMISVEKRVDGGQVLGEDKGQGVAESRPFATL